jgi:hypothetical protein
VESICSGSKQVGAGKLGRVSFVLHAVGLGAIDSCFLVEKTGCTGRRLFRELLYSTMIGANPALHTPMVTGPGPLDCFRAFFFPGRSRLG